MPADAIRGLTVLETTGRDLAGSGTIRVEADRPMRIGATLNEDEARLLVSLLEDAARRQAGKGG